jgi:hypothetical protein
MLASRKKRFLNCGSSSRSLPSTFVCSTFNATARLSAVHDGPDERVGLSQLRRRRRAHSGPTPHVAGLVGLFATKSWLPHHQP